MVVTGKNAENYILSENVEKSVIIPELSEPPARTLRATVPENERHIFR